MNDCGQCGQPLAPDHSCSGYTLLTILTEKIKKLKEKGYPQDGPETINIKTFGGSQALDQVLQLIKELQKND